MKLETKCKKSCRMGIVMVTQWVIVAIFTHTTKQTVVYKNDKMNEYETQDKNTRCVGFITTCVSNY